MPCTHPASPADSDYVAITEWYVLEDGELWPADAAVRAEWRALYAHSPLVFMGDYSQIEWIAEARLVSRREFKLLYPGQALP